MELNKKEIALNINQEIEKTILAIVKLKELTKPISPDDAIGRISRMDAINNKSINDNALRKAKLKLTNLKVALDKLDTNDFGVCDRCKNKIPLGRILLIPQSRFCVHCSS
jgi:DnaK suppressor protein